MPPSPGTDSSDRAAEMRRLRDDLQRIGLRADECVIVHSSFKSLGLEAGSPRDVIEALLAVLGEGGTLVMPTFTYSYAGAWNVEAFDPAATPGKQNGVLTEVLRQWPGARRSGHPTYSVAAAGRHAERITAGKERASALGAGSSYDEAFQLGVKILLLGVGNNRNSMLHYAEEAAGLPYLDIPWRAFMGGVNL